MLRYTSQRESYDLQRTLKCVNDISHNGRL